MGYNRQGQPAAPVTLDRAAVTAAIELRRRNAWTQQPFGEKPVKHHGLEAEPVKP